MKNNGILNQAGPVEQSATGTGGQPKVDPKIQEQFDIFTVNGMKIIHDQKVTDSFLGRMSSAQNPVMTIAEQTIDIVGRLVDSAAENNIRISNEVLVHGGNFIMGELMALAEQAGMQKLSEEQRRDCFQLAAGMFLDRAVKSGKMTPEQVRELGEQAKATPEGTKIAQDVGTEQMQPQGGNGILSRGGA